MRLLKFKVNKQLIEQDPSCDFTGLVPGTEGYLRAEFSFSPEWSGCVKVVSFSSVMGQEYEPQVLKDGKTCMIPSEALAKPVFKLSVMGKNRELQLVTNKVAVCQDGGKR